MSQIEVNKLTLAYSGTTVLEDLSFSVEKGEYICIVGENGSGKSTLIKALIGSVKPISGSIKFNGKCKFGYLPQQTDAQKDFPASVGEVVLSGFAAESPFLPFYGKLQKQKALHNMKLLGIEGLFDKCYRKLSGGQQQRALLARAFCAAGDILLLDEPITGLDPEAVKELYSVISDFKSNGITVIMVTHDVESALSVADKILHLSHKFSFFGATAEYLDTEQGKVYTKGGAI